MASNITPLSRQGEHSETFSIEIFLTLDSPECEIVGISSLELSLLQNLALDFLASFMLDLANSEKDHIQKRIETGSIELYEDISFLVPWDVFQSKDDKHLLSNSFCDDLADVLIKHKLCDSEDDALMTIIPPLSLTNVSRKVATPGTRTSGQR